MGFVAVFFALNETFSPALVLNETFTGFVTFLRAVNVTLRLRVILLDLRYLIILQGDQGS